MRVRLLQRVFRRRRKSEILQCAQRQQRAPRADRLTQRRPLRPGGLEQAYFVFREEDEIAVRICAETAFDCRRAEASERFQSSLVIVLKSGPVVRVREGAAADAGGLSGEGIFLHESAMRETSVAADSNATPLCRQVIRTGTRRPCTDVTPSQPFGNFSK